MRLTKAFTIVLSLAMPALLVLAGARTHEAGAASLQEAPAKPSQSADKLVYADFETMKDNRPVSSHGGLVQIVSYQESPSSPSRFKGLDGSNPPAPELVRLKQGDPNHAAAFDYELIAPNQYAGVGVEVHGEADKDGKPVPDDVSDYKFVSLQIYAPGVPSLRLELQSRGQGLGAPQAFPQTTFKVAPGLNTYKIPLKSLLQPEWAQPRVSTKDVLKKLTAVAVTAYCNQCTPAKGTVVMDNIVFEK
ncbi:MAG: hypothetical protein QOH51_50 [Acidobacteriota bacterium]|nr:hypothetical protein [Acidobacteriota bacterium]